MHASNGRHGAGERDGAEIERQHRNRLAPLRFQAIKQSPLLEECCTLRPEKVARDRVAGKLGSVDERDTVTAPRQEHRE